MNLFHFLLPLVLVTGVAHATSSILGEVGNGGHGVVCYLDPLKKVITSVDLFDYWEMKRELNLGSATLSLGTDQISVEEKINLFSNRLKQFNPGIAERIRKESLEIAQNIQPYLADVPLEIVEDDNSRLSPDAPCFREQFAVQVKTDSPNRKKILISKRLYQSPRTSNTTRAGIILHEVIYKMFIEKGDTNSLNAREFHYTLATNKFSELNQANFVSFNKLMESMELKNDRTISLWASRANRAIHLYKATVKKGKDTFTGLLFGEHVFRYPEFEVTYPEKKEVLFRNETNELVNIKGERNLKLNGVIHPVLTIDLYSNGAIEEFDNLAVAEIKDGSGQVHHCDPQMQNSTGVVLHKNGALLKCSEDLSFSLGTSTYHVGPVLYLNYALHSNGQLAFLDKEYSFKPLGCQTEHTFRSVEFDPSGKIIKSSPINFTTSDGGKEVILTRQIEGCTFLAKARYSVSNLHSFEIVSKYGDSSTNWMHYDDQELSKFCQEAGKISYGHSIWAGGSELIEAGEFYDLNQKVVRKVKDELLYKVTVVCDGEGYVNLENP